MKTDGRCPSCQWPKDAVPGDEPFESETRSTGHDRTAAPMTLRTTLNTWVRDKIVGWVTWFLVGLIPGSLMVAAGQGSAAEGVTLTLGVIWVFVAAPYMAKRTIRHYCWEEWTYWGSIHLSWIDMRMIIGLVPVIGGVLGIRTPPADRFE
jgi:hypothetical protein